MVDSDIFRVKIDLENFFSDHKSKAYVSVNRQWKNVRQFHRHITEIFDVKKFVLLANDGVYLHPKEHIDIIQSGDIIHVIAKKDDSESVISTGTEVMVTLTEKINTTGGTFKVPKEIISPENSINFATCDDDNADSVGTNETNSTASKRKRVRHRKRKNNSVGNDENEMNFPNIQASTITGGTPKNDTVQKSPRVKAISKCNTHVSAEPQIEKNDESSNQQSNDMNIAVNANDIDFHTSKIKYTRSQLIDIDDAAKSHANDTNFLNNSLIKAFDLWRKKTFDEELTAKQKRVMNWQKKKCEDKEKAQMLNEDLPPMSTTHNKASSDWNINTLTDALTRDHGFVLLNTNAKVDRWLSSGQNPSDYGNATVQAASVMVPVETVDLMPSGLNDLSTIKADETSSTVSNRSAIRARLLEKTSKVKQTLRNLTNNN